jgi:hypothetical protein
MNRVYLQLWVHSERGLGFLTDGCSLHIDLVERDKFISDVYLERDELVPEQYDRCFGDSFEVYVDDMLFESVRSQSNVRLDESSLRNLLVMEDIIIKN